MVAVIANNPYIRMGLYILAVVAQILAFFMRASGSLSMWAEACQSTANFLAGLSGMVALGNITVPTKPVQDGMMGQSHHD